MGGCIGDHGCQGGFTAGTCGSGNRDQGRQLAPYLQLAAQLINSSFGISNTGTNCLGAVHCRATTNGNQAIAGILLIDTEGILHILDRGVRLGFVIDHIGNILLFQDLLYRSGKSVGGDSFIRHHKD